MLVNKVEIICQFLSCLKKCTNSVANLLVHTDITCIVCSRWMLVSGCTLRTWEPTHTLQLPLSMASRNPSSTMLLLNTCGKLYFSANKVILMTCYILLLVFPNQVRPTFTSSYTRCTSDHGICN